MQIAKNKSISYEKFFGDLGVSYANFKGRQKESALGSNVLEKIISKYPEISPVWLLTGKGPMTLSVDSQQDETSPVVSATVQREIDTPPLPVSATAGALSGDVEEQKVSPIKQRILQYIETLNVSKRKFYEETGISRGTLESNTGITEEVMAKFIVTHPEISPVWLLTGKGPMTTSNIPQPSDVPLATPSPMGDQGIPLLPVSAMAGALSGDVSVLEYECERYVVPAFQGADFLIPVKGSSMYPKYSSGDIVACKRVPASDLFFQWNKVYVLDTDQGPLIKRIRRGSSDDTVLIVSDNTAYEPFELRRNQIRGIALVIGVIRLE